MDLIDIAIAKSLAESGKGQPGGTASLDDHGKVPAEQLPSYVDDITEGYYHDGKFYEDEQHTKEITPSKAVIYYDVVSGKDYRWTGSDYIEVPSGEITAEYISSAGATLGQVLTADGTGGASWEEASGDVFTIIFGTTTVGEVKQALNDGKTILGKYNINANLTNYYYTSQISNTSLTMSLIPISENNSNGHTVAFYKFTINLSGSDSTIINLPTSDKEIVPSNNYKATNSLLGLVKVDGTTITVDNNGVISANIPSADNAISATSENPVQNKIITQYLAPVLGTPADPSAVTYNFLFDKPEISYDPDTEMVLECFCVGSNTATFKQFHLVFNSTVHKTIFENGLYGIIRGTGKGSGGFGARAGSFVMSNVSENLPFSYTVHSYNLAGTETTTQSTDTCFANTTNSSIISIIGSYDYVTASTPSLQNLPEGTAVQGYSTSWNQWVNYSTLANTGNYNFTFNGSAPATPWEDLQERVTTLENNPGGADWNAQEDEAGFIENKPFDIPFKDELTDIIPLEYADDFSKETNITSYGKEIAITTSEPLVNGDMIEVEYQNPQTGEDEVIQSTLMPLEGMLATEEYVNYAYTGQISSPALMFMTNGAEAEFVICDNNFTKIIGTSPLTAHWADTTAPTGEAVLDDVTAIQTMAQDASCEFLYDVGNDTINIDFSKIHQGYNNSGITIASHTTEWTELSDDAVITFMCGGGRDQYLRTYTKGQLVDYDENGWPDGSHPSFSIEYDSSTGDPYLQFNAPFLSYTQKIDVYYSEYPYVPAKIYKTGKTKLSGDKINIDTTLRSDDEKLTVNTSTGWNPQDGNVYQGGLGTGLHGLSFNAGPGLRFRNIQDVFELLNQEGITLNYSQAESESFGYDVYSIEIALQTPLFISNGINNAKITCSHEKDEEIIKYEQKLLSDLNNHAVTESWATGAISVNSFALEFANSQPDGLVDTMWIHVMVDGYHEQGIDSITVDIATDLTKYSVVEVDPTGFITSGTTPLEDGVSPLATGTLYCYYTE